MHHSVHQKWHELDSHGLSPVSVESIEHHVMVNGLLQYTGVCKNTLVCEVNTSGSMHTQIIPCQDGQRGRPSCRFSSPGRIGNTKSRRSHNGSNFPCVQSYPTV